MSLPSLQQRLTKSIREYLEKRGFAGSDLEEVGLQAFSLYLGMIMERSAENFDLAMNGEDPVVNKVHFYEALIDVLNQSIGGVARPDPFCCDD